MSKGPIIIKKDKVEKLNRVLLSSKTFKEEWIQETLEKNPDVLPTSEISSMYSPLIFIAREVNVESGYIDNLYISSKGHLVLVETKLWRNPESRREVVGQIIDYAKDLKNWSYEEIDNLYKNYHNTTSGIFEKLVTNGYQSREDEAIFIDIVEKNIENARFLLMIVGDGIREGVKNMVEFLNSTPNMQYQFALCELEIYELSDSSKLIIPRITTKTKIVERGIIRVDQNNNLKEIVMHEELDKDVNKKTYNKSDYLTLDEWLKISIEPINKTNEFKLLLEDFIDLGFEYTIGTANLNIYYNDIEKRQRLKMFAFGNDGETIEFQPLRFYRFAKKHNLSNKLVDELLNKLKLYLRSKQKNKPYDRAEGYYYISISNMLDKKEEILLILERFISYL